MRLRSGDLRMDDIPDLNLNNEPEIVSSEEGGGECCTVSKIVDQSNVSACELKVVDRDEGQGRNVQNEERVKGPMSNGQEVSKVNCADVDVGGNVKDIGADKATDDVLAIKGLGFGAIGEKSLCRQGVVGSGVDDSGRYRVPKTCASDLDQPLKSSSEGMFGKSDQIDRLNSESKEEWIQVFGEVLRPRVVTVNELGEEASDGRTRPIQYKRKRETGQGKAAVTLKDEASHSHVSKRLCSSRSPKTSVDLSIGEVVELSNVRHESKTENEGVSTRSQLEAEKKSVGSWKQSRRSERSNRLVDYSENEAARRRKLSGSKTEAVSEDKNVGLSNAKVASSRAKTKCGNRSDDEKVKASPVTHPIRQRRQETDNHGKATVELSGGIVLQTVGTSDSNHSVKRKWGETPGSLAAEKNLIKNQIVDMLLRAGWTIERRPRNGRDYLDAVYVTPEGKTHWSVTKAYSFLLKEFNEGKTSSISSNPSFSFTPLPEEALSKLYRCISKHRSDKNTKKKDNAVTKDKRGSKAGLKSNSSALKKKLSVRHGTQSKRRSALLARRAKGLNSESFEAIAYPGKHSILAWLIGSGVVSVDEKVRYMNRRKTRTMLEGSITRDGIHCHCCEEVFSVTQFEKHSGCRLDQPYENLYLETGRSLLQCLLESWNKQGTANLNGFCSASVDADDLSDDTCVICGDGGKLMCCDGCPSTFHHDCLGIEEVPSGEWYCVSCTCKFCGGTETASSLLATCCLCEQKYHQSCADGVNVAHNKSGKGTVCGKNCEQIFEQLQALIGTKSDLGDGFSWTLLQRFDVKEEADSLEAVTIRDNSKLAVALSVMDECFVPIIDPRSGVNLIRHVVYNSGSYLRRLNFRSFFTIVLEKGDELISAASIRIHGKQLAEMPFIGTRNVYRRQGMCRRLLAAVELALSSLNVQNLVIPAISELLDTWTSIFGFQPLEENVRAEMKSMNLLVFAHTDMLQKPLSNHSLIDKGIAKIDGKCLKASDDLFDGGAEKSEVDDCCFSVSFDLNVVAPGIPESSSDERLASCNAEDCADDGKSGVASMGLNETDIVDGQPTPLEIIDNRAHSSTFAMNTSDTLSTPEFDSGHTETALVIKASEEMTINLDMNLKELDDNVFRHNNISSPRLIVPDKSEDGPRESSKLTSSIVDTSATRGNTPLEEKLVSESDILDTSISNSPSATGVDEKLDLHVFIGKVCSKPEIRVTSLPVSHSATYDSSNDSMLTAAESIECLEPDLPVVCTNVTRVSSASSCVSTAGETTTTGLFLGSDCSKVSSN